MQRDIAAPFRDAEPEGCQGGAHASTPTVAGDHGRSDTRPSWVRAVPEVLAERNPKGTWARVRAIGLALTQQHTGTASHERRYSVLRGTPSVPRGAHAVRGHGGIENCLHWVFDVTFDEERSRVRRGNAAQNFAVLRHSALNLLRHEPSTGSIKTKPVRAALDAHSLRTGVQP